MFNSTVLEVAIGRVFCFASVALIVSALNEAIASLLGLRSRTLLTGVQDLLNDDQFNGLARDIYNHALINPPIGGGRAERDRTHEPAVLILMQEVFSSVLIDCIQKITGDFGKLGSDIDAISNPQLKQLLAGFYAKAAGDSRVLHQQLSS